MKTVIITTGGTGGHIFPALAVTEELLRRYPNLRIIFMGSKHGPEVRLAKEAHLEYKGLPVKGMFGRGIKAVGAGFSMLRSVILARAYINKVQADLVVGFGGYASAAGVLGGVLAGVPTAVHEQNSLPGVANKVAARFSDRVFISMPEAQNFFAAEKTKFTGNPVRLSIAALHHKKNQALKAKSSIDSGIPDFSIEAGDADLNQEPPRSPKHLLVMGGSQGAMAINDLMLSSLLKLLEDGIKIYWQAGAGDYERVRDGVRDILLGGDYGKLGDLVSVHPFINDMAKAYTWADLAVCRAGATTVAELASAGVPAFFVPFPYATHNHQVYNAKDVEKQGAAVVIEQKDLNTELFSSTILKLFADTEKLQAMQEAALKMAKPDAVARLVDELEILGQTGTKWAEKKHVGNKKSGKWPGYKKTSRISKDR